jgi:hypothetical protein
MIYLLDLFVGFTGDTVDKGSIDQVAPTRSDKRLGGDPGMAAFPPKLTGVWWLGQQLS